MARVDLHMIRRDIRYDPDFGVVLHALGITWQFKYVMQTLLGRGRPYSAPTSAILQQSTAPRITVECYVEEVYDGLSAIRLLD